MEPAPTRGAVPRVPRGQRRVCRSARRLAGRDAPAPQRDFLLAVHDTVELDAFADQTVTGTLDLPAEALLRLVYGRLDPAHTPPVALAAGVVTLDDLRPVFPGL